MSFCNASIDVNICFRDQPRDQFVLPEGAPSRQLLEIIVHVQFFTRLCLNLGESDSIVLFLSFATCSILYASLNAAILLTTPSKVGTRDAERQSTLWQTSSGPLGSRDEFFITRFCWLVMAVHHISLHFLQHMLRIELARSFFLLMV